jgi:hypothetical protein
VPIPGVAQSGSVVGFLMSLEGSLEGAKAAVRVLIFHYFLRGVPLRLWLPWRSIGAHRSSDRPRASVSVFHFKPRRVIQRGGKRMVLRLIGAKGNDTPTKEEGCIVAK